MGCGAAKEAEEPHDDDDRRNDQRGQQHNRDRRRDQRRDGDADGAAAPARAGPPTTLDQLQTLWPAGRVAPQTPPHFIDARCGPHTRREKLPPQTDVLERILISDTEMPSRVVEANDEAAQQKRLLAGAVGGLHLRGYLPHSLSGYCVGWAKPRMDPTALVEGFAYDMAADGRADLDAIAAGDVIDDVSHRRRLLLFPETIDAVALFLYIDGSDAPVASPLVAPLSAAADATGVEPVDGAFATLAAMTPKGTIARQSVPTTRVENSIGVTLWTAPPPPPADPEPRDSLSTDSGGGKDDDDEAFIVRAPAAAPAAAPSALDTLTAQTLLALPDGDHELKLALRYRYHVGATLAAVYVKPAAASGASQRVCGSYLCDGSETSELALSDVVACGTTTVALTPTSRALLQRSIAQDA